MQLEIPSSNECIKCSVLKCTVLPKYTPPPPSQWARASPLSKLLDHAPGHTTPGRTALGEL